MMLHCSKEAHLFCTGQSCTGILRRGQPNPTLHWKATRCSIGGGWSLSWGKEIFSPFPIGKSPAAPTGLLRSMPEKSLAQIQELMQDRLGQGWALGSGIHAYPLPRQPACGTPHSWSSLPPVLPPYWFPSTLPGAWCQLNSATSVPTYWWPPQAGMTVCPSWPDTSQTGTSQLTWAGRSGFCPNKNTGPV